MVIEARPDIDAAASIFSGRFRVLTIGMIILVTLIAFEAMAVGPALPTAARELHGLSAFGWAFTAFLLTNIIGMVVSGQLCDSVGPRLPMVTGVGLFAAGLAIAGTATTMAQLVGARAVQGLGSGLLLTAIYVVIGRAYGARQQPKVFTAISSAWLVPSLVGPAISGTVTQQLSWRWVFLGLLPFIVLGSVLLLPAMRTLRRPDEPTPANSRTIVNAVVLAASAAALSEAGRDLTPVTGVLGAAGLAGLAWALHGLLPAGTFRVRPGVPAAVALRALFACAAFGGETLVPLMMSQQHGLGATAAGLPLTAAGLSWAAGSWWQSRDVPGDDGQRRARLMRTGFVLLTVGLVSVALISLPSVPWALMYPAWAIVGLGAGLSITTAGVLLLKWTTDTDRGRDSAALQLADTTATSLTTGLSGVLVAAAVAGSIAYTAAFVSMFAAMAAVALVGVAVSGRANRSA